ncbi:hypothetical protein NFT50_004831 [Salmonella enterica]|nr:hypothetical protein [Salmonella enterica]EJH7016128.1 hypothetical protein [Salmonella enterica]EJH7437815.1 hypothetical protein [Salmonella enterica]EJH7877110.1 hypothetical protein [Salmonella enterica]EJH7880978.1 hypothetical protein [Salmonella enterica]
MNSLFHPAQAGRHRYARRLKSHYSGITASASTRRQTAKSGQPKESPLLVGEGSMAGWCLALLVRPIKALCIACRGVITYGYALAVYRLYGVIHVEYSVHGAAGFVLVRYSFLTARRVNQVLDSLPSAHIRRGGTVWRVATLITDTTDAGRVSERLHGEAGRARPVPPPVNRLRAGICTLAALMLVVCAFIAAEVCHA